MSVKKGNTIRNYFTEEELPKCIKVMLSTKKHIFMYLSRFPKIMRIYSSKRKEDYEQHYSEMQLFLPWRNEEEDLQLNDEGKCVDKFNKFKKTIYMLKRKILPYANFSEDMNDLMNSSEGKTRASHMYNTLDVELEKDNSDAEDEECEAIPRPETNFDIYEDSQVERNEKGDGKYKSLVLKNDEDMLEMARGLVPEQMMILQEVIKFCKLPLIPRTMNVQTSSQLRLIVHWGAGESNDFFLHILIGDSFFF